MGSSAADRAEANTHPFGNDTSLSSQVQVHTPGPAEATPGPILQRSSCTCPKRTTAEANKILRGDTRGTKPVSNAKPCPAPSSGEGSPLRVDGAGTRKITTSFIFLTPGGRLQGDDRVTTVDALYIFYQYYGICSIFHRSHSSDPTAVWKMDLRGEWWKGAMCSKTRSLLLETRTFWRGTLEVNTRTPAQPTGDFQTGSKTDSKETPLEGARGRMRERGPPNFAEVHMETQRQEGKKSGAEQTRANSGDTWPSAW